MLITALIAATGCAAGAPAAGTPDSALPPVNPALPVIPAHDFNLADYGANGDGKTLNTDAFTKAIAAISSAGGGRLIVPKGTYLTLPFSLASHLNLHLETGAVIQFPQMLSTYGLPDDPTQATTDQIAKLKGNWKALITGDHLTDVSITGDGAIDGGGSIWWNVASPTGAIRARYGNDRPKLIILSNSSRLLFQGVTLQNSPMWQLVPTLCHDVTIEQIHVLAPARSPNTDAIDPMSCDNVLIRDCDLDIGDDNVAIKAINGPCTNILIEDLRCKHGHGISIGSETYKGIHNVTVRNCTFDSTANGIRIKSARDRGNQIYGFRFSDITMKNVGVAITLNMYYMDRTGGRSRAAMPITDSTPYLHDAQITNVTATGSQTAGEIIGLPESPVKDVTLTNVKLEAAKGMTVRDAQGVVFNNVSVTAGSGEAITWDHAEGTVDGVEK